MSIKTVVNSIRKLDTQTAVTMQEMVLGLVDACTATFGGNEMTPDEVASVQDEAAKDAPWSNTSSEAARRSEIKACLIAYPFYFADACGLFRRQFGELRRTHVLMVARQLPKHESWRNAVTAVIEKIRAKKVTTVVSAEKKLSNALAAIRSIDTRAQKIVKFRKELNALVAKHGLA